MASRDEIEAFMKNFPSQELILSMEPEDLGTHMLKYMMGTYAETHRFNFMQMVFPGQISERFMEAWGWLEREGFVAHRPNDINGNAFFVTRAGQRVAQATNFDAWRQELMFPGGLDPIIMSKVKPEFLRGEYEMAVFRCFKEVEMRVRDKDPSLAGEFRRRSHEQGVRAERAVDEGG